MKALAFCVLFLLSFRFFAAPVHKTHPASLASGFDSLEVLVSITANDRAIYTQVKNTISSIPGVQYFSYCDNHAVFMVYIDKTVYASADRFKEQLYKLIPDDASRISLKSGISFKELMTNCNSADANDAAAIKNSVGK